MKILVLKPNEDLPIHENIIVRGLGLESTSYPSIDKLKSYQYSRFDLKINNYDTIISKMPLALLDRRFVNVKNQEAPVFKYVRPFLVSKGSLLRFIPYRNDKNPGLTFDGRLLVYCNYILDKQIEEYMKNKNLDSLEYTRIRVEEIPYKDPTYVIKIEKTSRLISIGFLCGRRIEGAEITEEFLPICEVPYGAIVSGPLPYEIRGQLLLSGSKFAFFEVEYMSLRQLMGDMQDGIRHVLKGIYIGKLIKRTLYEHLQINLEKSISDYNATLPPDARITSINVFLEFVHV